MILIFKKFEYKKETKSMKKICLHVIISRVRFWLILS